MNGPGKRAKKDKGGRSREDDEAKRAARRALAHVWSKTVSCTSSPYTRRTPHARARKCRHTQAHATRPRKSEALAHV